VLVSLVGAAAQAFAAEPSGGRAGQDARSDGVSDREDALDDATSTVEQNVTAAQPTPPQPRALNLRITAPFDFNSNARERGWNASPALEGDPEVELGWSRALSTVPLKLSIKLRADTDRFAGVPQADEDEASAAFKAQYYDATNDQALAPFVSYKSTAMFQPTFSPWTQTKNDFNLGLTKSFNFDASLRQLPPAPRSSTSAVWSVTVTASVQRRLRTPIPDSTALIGGIEVGYVPAKSWNILLGVTNTERWYDTATIRSRTVTRRDFKVEPLLTVAWEPPGDWFGSPVIALQVGFEQQISTLSRANYNQWTVGPTLSAGWKF
jgi:hypothetical protein